MNYNNIFTKDQLTKKEIFSNQFTSVAIPKLFAQLLVVSLKEGIDRVENAIKNTYTKEDSTKIIYTLNLIFKN